MLGHTGYLAKAYSIRHGQISMPLAEPPLAWKVWVCALRTECDTFGSQLLKPNAFARS